MKHKKIIIMSVILIVMNAFAAGTVNLKDIQFKYAAEKSSLELTFDKEVQVTKTVSEADKQVVLEIKDAKISKKLSRKLDTSSFNGNVTLISPYQSENNVRIVLQLKSVGDVDLTTTGEKTVAMISNNLPAGTEVAKTEDPKLPDAAKPEEVKTEAQAEAKAEESKADASAESAQALVDALQTKQYKGRKITVQLQSADLQDVFKVISEASDLNIIMADDVRGKVSLNLYDVPWDQVLDIILKSNKLTAEKSGNVLRIATLDAVTKEKEAELTAKKAVESVEPLVVKIFPISFAKIDELKKILTDFLSKEIVNSGRPGDSGTISSRGSIQVDTRTNALVVRDTASSIEKIKRIIKELDTQTPQILVEAKFVEVSEDKSHEVQGRIFATSREFSASSNQLAFNNDRGNVGATFGGAGLQAGGLPNGFSITPVAGASFGFSPKTSGILPPGLRDLAAFLGILESESNSKVIASPRVIAQNKEPAEISQGKSLQIAVPAGPNVAGGFQTINAVLRLQVTPQVTSEGSINLKLSFSQDAPSANKSGASFATDTKKVDTTVLVDSGATLVIGGIYSSTELNAASGIPFLRDLPLIGYFFGDRSSTNSKNELFIFITPRILNEKESGIQG